MAAETPTTVDAYCKTFQIAFENLSFPCLFCKRILTAVQINDFVFKQLSLVWKEKNCFACCSYCLKVTARYELENYFCCYVTGFYIEDLLGTPLWLLVVRCLKCLAKLTYIEKLRCVFAKENFYLVRGHWRSYCRDCLKDNDRT